MEAQSIKISLHDESAGYDISPARVPLVTLRTFANDVHEFLRGEAPGADGASLEVAVVEGSLAILTGPVTDGGLLADLRHLARSDSIDSLNARRRTVVERWQKAAKSARHARYSISAPMLARPVVISAESDFRSDDADQWVRVERYVRGEIEDLGGSTRTNAHIRLPDGHLLKVDTDRAVLRDEKINRLYKPAMVRISARYNVVTREYRDARLIEFVEYDTRIDEKQLDRLFERGARAWSGVADAAEWVEKLRGNEA